MRRVRGGDGRAAEELVRRYEPTIRRVVRVRLVDPRLQRLFDSMDICQSVFGSFFVHAALGDYELATPEQLLGLLVSMSRKKVVDKSRRAGAARLPPGHGRGRRPGEAVGGGRPQSESGGRRERVAAGIPAAPD
jgi:RNA polymerase sigma-70 factor (ECF subfamily)